MKYKFIDEHNIEAFEGRSIEYNGRRYANPKPETIAMAGYKDLKEGDYPDFNPETEFITDKYIDGDVITHVYEVHAIEEIPENDIIS